MYHAEEFADRLRDFITTGYPPGEPRFLTENALAEEFSLNRSTSRKLLLELQGEGAVRCTPKGYVREDYRATPREVVYEIRSTIEGIAARLAASGVTRRDHIALRLALEEMEAALTAEDLATYDRADVDFHTALVRAAHDPLLEKIFAFLAWTAGVPGTDDPAGRLPRERVALAAHRAIYDAVAAHDPHRAETLVRRHTGTGFRTDAGD